MFVFGASIQCTHKPTSFSVVSTIVRVISCLPWTLTLSKCLEDALPAQHMLFLNIHHFYIHHFFFQNNILFLLAIFNAKPHEETKSGPHYINFKPHDFFVILAHVSCNFHTSMSWTKWNQIEAQNKHGHKLYPPNINLPKNFLRCIKQIYVAL